jgi:starch-binding outer membrane protein, SusD/RagB family
MKKYLLLIAPFMAIILMSCNSILDLNPTDQISSGSFWKTKSDADLALSGVYSKLRLDIISAGGGGGTLCHWDGLTDNAYCTYSWEGSFTTLATVVTPSSGGVLSSLYTGAYQGIAVVNDFLANVDKIQDASFTAALKAQYIAEVKFIRAYWYYWLTQCYQDVPYTDQPLTVTTMKMAVTKKADIVKKLMSDLDECIANLPDITYVASEGHIVKGSAQALKARIQLFNGDYSGAATTAKAIIDGGKFSLYTTGSTPYADLFAGDLSQSSFPEIMFSTRFLYPYFTHRLEMQINGWASVEPTPDFAFNYQTGDARKAQSIAYFGDPYKVGKLSGFNTVPVKASWIISGMVMNKYTFKRDYASADDKNEGTHIIHIRYAEVLLTYAEAQNQVNNGPDASAYAAINAVRSRAGLPNLTAGLTKAQFQDSVIRERRYEFFAEEAMRYMDLKRLKLAGTLLPKIPFPYPANADGTFSTSNISTYMTWNNKWYVWPIPQSEVDKDPDNLKQVNIDRGY